MNKAVTLGELKASGYQTRSVKDEMRATLIKKLRSGEKLLNYAVEKYGVDVQ